MKVLILSRLLVPQPIRANGLKWGISPLPWRGPTFKPGDAIRPHNTTQLSPLSVLKTGPNQPSLVPSPPSRPSPLFSPLPSADPPLRSLLFAPAGGAGGGTGVGSPFLLSALDSPSLAHGQSFYGVPPLLVQVCFSFLFSSTYLIFLNLFFFFFGSAWIFICVCWLLLYCFLMSCYWTTLDSVFIHCAQ